MDDMLTDLEFIEMCFELIDSLAIPDTPEDSGPAPTMPGVRITVDHFHRLYQCLPASRRLELGLLWGAFLDRLRDASATRQGLKLALGPIRAVMGLSAPLGIHADIEPHSDATRTLSRISLGEGGGFLLDSEPIDDLSVERIVRAERLDRSTLSITESGEFLIGGDPTEPRAYELKRLLVLARTQGRERADRAEAERAAAERDAAIQRRRCRRARSVTGASAAIAALFGVWALSADDARDAHDARVVDSGAEQPEAETAQASTQYAPTSVPDRLDPNAGSQKDRMSADIQPARGGRATRSRTAHIVVASEREPMDVTILLDDSNSTAPDAAETSATPPDVVVILRRSTDTPAPNAIVITQDMLSEDPIEIRFPRNSHPLLMKGENRAP